MSKDRKTLTDADIVSHRRGRSGKPGVASDADSARTSSDKDVAGHKSPPKAAHDKGDARAKSDDRAKGDDKGKGHD